MLHWMSLFILIATPHAQAATGLKAPDPALSLYQSGRILAVEATPPAGHHINTQAPMSLEIQGTGKKLKPAQVSEKSVVFNIPSVPVTVTATLYLCDDAKSFCEKHELTHSWQRPDGNRIFGKPSPKQPPGHAQKEKGGFILNDSDRAFSTAKALKKPLIIDFFAIWCPPCNMLDAEVFGSPDFKKASEPFVKLKMDADSDVSWKLRSRYRIGGYPTIVFATPDGDEILRVVGFRPRSELVSEVAKAWSLRNEPVAALETKAAANDRTAKERLGMLHLERREYSEAVRYLKDVPAQKEALFTAELALLEDSTLKGGGKERLAAKLREAIEAFPKSPDSIDRRMRLAEIEGEAQHSEKQKLLLGQAAELAESLAENPTALQGLDYLPAELWVAAAEAREELGETGRSQALWKKASAEYAKGAISEKERGNNLERAYCLWKSGDIPAAEAIYTRLEKAYPTEFTFFYAHASMKLKLKQAEGAEKLAEKALIHSYGDNRLRVTLLLVKSYQANGKTDAARALIRKTLESAKDPEDQTLRTHKYIQDLKNLIQN